LQALSELTKASNVSLRDSAMKILLDRAISGIHFYQKYDITKNI